MLVTHRRPACSYSDGCGDLIFEEYATTSYDPEHGRRRHVVQRGFMGIANVRDVERQVRETLLPEKSV